MDGKVTTAYPLDPESLKGIAGKFSERLGAAVTLRQEVDPSLISGFVVQIGFLRFDYSARAKLKEMMRHMLGEA